MELIDQVIDDVVPYNIEAIIHMGANSSTTEKDADYLMSNNYHYTLELAKYCLEKHPIYLCILLRQHTEMVCLDLKMTNQNLKHFVLLICMDTQNNFLILWVKRNDVLDRIVGIKYFNVYGPNEYHKGDMRSVVHKAFEQVRDLGKVRLFKSLNPKYKDGEQMRDFVYIKDAVDMTLYFLDHPDENGIFNVGAGKARH